MLGGCRCDCESLYWIEKGGFKIVQSEKLFSNFTPEMFSGCENIFLIWISRILLSIVNSILVGFAEKEQFTEEKKLL